MAISSIFPMKMIRPSFIVLLLAGCMSTMAQTTSTPSKTPGASKTTPFQQKDTANWIDNLRHFRDAVYQKDIAKTKAFFSFPVAREGNEIWYLAYGANEQKIDMLTDKPKPFTEKDLEQYYSKLFPKAFINSLLKVKTDILYRKGSFETPVIKEGSQTYILYATYDKTSGMLELNLALKTGYIDAGNDEDEVGESNIIYAFKVLPNGHLQFSHVSLAG